jgi:hypothetical protein
MGVIEGTTLGWELFLQVRQRINEGATGRLGRLTQAGLVCRRAGKADDVVISRNGQQDHRSVVHAYPLADDLTHHSQTGLALPYPGALARTR